MLKSNIQYLFQELLPLVQMTPSVATHPATRMVVAVSSLDQGWTKDKTEFKISHNQCHRSRL